MCCQLQNDLMISLFGVPNFCVPAASTTRYEVDEHTAAQLTALCSSIHGLLVPSPQSRAVLAYEPRDAFGGSVLLNALLDTAAKVGLELIEQNRRRLDGQQRPDWQTDIYVFRLAVHT